MRDQLFDHKIGAVRFYLDQEIRCDTKACFLGRPSNEIVQKMARCARLTADMNAPTKLSAEQQGQLQEHPLIVKLSGRSRAITKKLHVRGYRPISTGAGTDLYARKKRADARLNSTKMRLREKMLRQSRERHFRSADTRALDAQFSGSVARPVSKKSEPQAAAPLVFNVPERAELVRLTCTPVGDLSDEEKLARRIRVVELRAALCRRQEGRRGMPKAKLIKEEPQTQAESSCGNADGQEPDPESEHFPLECKPTQCTFCIGNGRLTYRSRVFAYKRLNKLRDHVEKRHLSGIAPDNPVHCGHPVCVASDLVLSSVTAFKRHTKDVHKIDLRP